jgi:hypothetical protein
MELILALLAWLGQMPAAPAPAPPVAMAQPARATSPLPPRSLGGLPGGLVGEDRGDQSTGAPPADRPVPILALADDRVDADENGHPGQDEDWEGFLHFGLSAAQAGFDRMIRLPLSPGQAKWLYRAWGQP